MADPLGKTGSFLFDGTLAAGSAGMTYGPNFISLRNRYNDGSCEVDAVNSRLDGLGRKVRAGISVMGGTVATAVLMGMMGAPEAAGGDVGLAARAGENDIALGLDPHYKALAEQTGAARWQQWGGRIINNPTSPRFGRMFHQAAGRASTIHFALDGIENTDEAVRLGARGFFRNNFTNAELHYIMTNAEMRAKTIFYRAGIPIAGP